MNKNHSNIGSNRPSIGSNRPSPEPAKENMRPLTIKEKNLVQQLETFSDATSQLYQSAKELGLIRAEQIKVRAQKTEVENLQTEVNDLLAMAMAALEQ